MPESASAEVKTIAHAAEETFDEFALVLAEYAAPILGILIGFWGAHALGGGYAIGNAINSLVNPKNAASMYQSVNFAAGALLGGVFIVAGGAIWAISSKHKGSSLGSALSMGLTRFIAGLLLGLGLGNVVAGVTNNPTQGWIESAVKPLGVQTGA